MVSTVPEGAASGQSPPSPISLPSPTTTELVRAACAGDPRAWAELVGRYQGLVRSIVVSYRLQDADVADAVQNTWLRAVERLHTLRDPDRLGGWLITIARRECLALLARAGREAPAEVERMDLVVTDPGPEAVVLVAETRRAVAGAVAELAPRRQELVRALFGTPEPNYFAISRDLGMPLGSIGPTRQRALCTLRGRLVVAGQDGVAVA